MDSIVLTSIATFFVNNYSFYGSFMFLELCGVVNFGLKHTVLCTKKLSPKYNCTQQVGIEKRVQKSRSIFMVF